MSRNASANQTVLNVGLDINTDIKTLVIKRQMDFDNLFFNQGFTSMKSVSYVVSPNLILGYFL